MIEWNIIAPRLGEWAPNFEPFYHSGGFEEIFKELKEQGKEHNILPKGKDLFKAFDLCPKSKFRACLVGMDPYYMVKYGKVVADGLAFSCSNTNEEQPSLRLIWDAIEDDLHDGLDLTKIRFTDLTPWAREGILLLNSSLTTIEGTPGKHVELWRSFINFFFTEVMAGISGIPFVFMGRQAEQYAPLVNEKMNYKLVTEHPSFANREHRPFKHKKMFSWIDGILKANNNETINWYNVPF